MRFSEDFRPAKKAAEEAQPALAERVREKKVFVDAGKREYIVIDPHMAHKIEELLHHQAAVISGDDVEQLFAASDHIAGGNCHKTSLYLTDKYTEEQLFAPDNDHPTTAGHEYVEEHSKVFADTEAFERALIEREFPFRISFFKQQKDGTYFAYHSITVLGISNKERLVGFEKEGPYADTPFRYIEVNSTIGQFLAAGYVAGLEE